MTTPTLPCETARRVAAAAFRAADLHDSGCTWCHADTPLADMCQPGQQLALAAAATLTPSPSPLAELEVGTADAFERALRETVRVELDYWADTMEARDVEDSQVRRDAYWIREAGDAARNGIHARVSGDVDDHALSHMSEIGRLRKLRDEEIVLRQVAEDWANTLAYAIAPVEVIGTHGVEGEFPWGDALDLVTPAARVTALRAALLAAEGGQPAPADGSGAWTEARSREIRTMLRSMTSDGVDAAPERPEVVDVAALLDAALDLQLHVDGLERRVRDLERDAAEAAPDRMSVLRPEFLEHASVEALTSAVRRAAMNRTRWETRHDRLVKLRNERVTGSATPAPGAVEATCPQNRTTQYIRLEDPVRLGPHLFPGEEDTVRRCLYCDQAEGGTGPEAVIPTYVHNADSVNRNVVKHFVHPVDRSRTWCPRNYRASAPMAPEEAALRSMCVGCRRAATGQS